MEDILYGEINHLSYSQYYDKINDIIHKIQCLNATRATKIDRTCQQQNRYYRQHVVTFYVTKQFSRNFLEIHNYKVPKIYLFGSQKKCKTCLIS